mmetsp:Transcript_108295/g.345862  ORF Transcript_108295/g.345862 Transcript_108295/m.345862 type:complete len:307 (-) Transcript_108295:1114-2034(-)
MQPSSLRRPAPDHADRAKHQTFRCLRQRRVSRKSPVLPTSAGEGQRGLSRSEVCHGRIKHRKGTALPTVATGAAEARPCLCQGVLVEQWQRRPRKHRERAQCCSNEGLFWICGCGGPWTQASNLEFVTWHPLREFGSTLLREMELEAMDSRVGNASRPPARIRGVKHALGRLWRRQAETFVEHPPDWKDIRGVQVVAPTWRVCAQNSRGDQAVPSMLARPPRPRKGERSVAKHEVHERIGPRPADTDWPQVCIRDITQLEGNSPLPTSTEPQPQRKEEACRRQNEMVRNMPLTLPKHAQYLPKQQF